MKLSLFVIVFYANISYAISIEDAISKLNQNEAWQRSTNQILQKENQLELVVSSMFPFISLQGSLTKQDEAPNPLVGDEQRQIFLNLTQPLFQGFKEFRSKNYSKLVLKAQKLTHQSLKRELTYNVVQLYFRLLQAQLEVELLQEAHSISANIESEMIKREKIGLVRKSELLSAKAQTLKTQTMLEAAEDQLSVLKTNFWRFIGEKEKSSDFPIPPNRQVVPEIEKVYAEHPTIEASKVMLQAGQELVKVEQSDYYPNLGLGLNYYLEQEGVFNERQWDATVSLSFPIYNGGRTSKEVYQARLQEREAAIALLTAQRNLHEVLKNLKTLYTGAAQRLETQKTSVQMANKNYLELRRENRLKLITNIEVMSGLNQYIQEKRAYNQLRLNMLNYQYQLLALAGTI